jgi:hypothetical protein
MDQTRTPVDSLKSDDVSDSESLPIKVLFVATAQKLFPHPGRGNYENSREMDAHQLGANRFRDVAQTVIEALVKTFIDLGAPVAEMKIMELMHRLGDADWREQHRGEIVICRFDNEGLLEQLWSELRDREIDTDQVTLTRFFWNDGEIASVTLDEQYGPKQTFDLEALADADDARLAASNASCSR